MRTPARKSGVNRRCIDSRKVLPMVQSQLSAYSGSDPIWGFVALVRAELFTGEAAVGLDPRVRLFAVDGHIYFAEREDDLPVGTRLVNCGVITAMQLARGTVQAGGHESLARLFQRDATIDRDAVELTIESATESLLATIAQQPVGMPEVFALRQHPAGMHHWLRATPAPLEHDVDSSAAVAATVAEPIWAVPPDAIKVVQTAPPILAEPVATMAPGLPTLAPLNNAPPPVANPVRTPAPAEPMSMPVSAFEPAAAVFEDPSLPRLAASPISISDLKAAAAASEPWSSSSNKMATVQIWEMVDDLFDDGQHQELRVGSGAPQERSRGWRRKKH